MATIKQNGTRLEKLPEELAEMAREVWLAGLGVMATVEEEGTKLYDSFVERGKKLDKESTDLFNALVKKGKKLEDQGRKQITGAVDEVKTTQRQYTKKAENRFDEVANRFGELLERFGVPTRDEVKTLTTKVNDLAAKVDALVVVLEKKNGKVAAKAEVKAAPARTTYHVVPHEEGWAVKKEGGSRATSVHGTKAEAVESARALAKEQEPSTLVIHKQDGTIQDTVSYDA